MSGAEQAPREESRNEIEARAADFLHRRRVLRWTRADQTELEAWLEQATSHRVAYLRLEESEALIQRVVDLRADGLEFLSGRRRRRYAIPLLAIAASLALVAGLGVAAKRLFAEPPDRTYATEVGGRALLSFADRTQIELNTDTAVRFRMTTDERTVWLEKGEAWFRVTHDPAHPFTVIVGNRRVTDLGTEFLIRSEPGRFEVALVKGRAQLSTGGDRPQFATLTSGDEAVATPVSISFMRKTPGELADELAWQHGILKFRNTKLVDAVRELNRYNRTKLVIGDPAVGGMLIGGDFKTDSIDGFLQAVQLVLKLRVVHDGANIVLSREAGEPKRAAGVNRSL